MTTTLSLRRITQGLCRRVYDLWRGETDRTSFNIYDLPRVNGLLASLGVSPLSSTDPHPLRAGLARWATSPRLRRRYQGDLRRYLPSGSGLGDRVGLVYAYREDLRESFPYGLTPRGRAGYLAWLLQQGQESCGLSQEEVLWHLYESDADSSRGLVDTYRFTPHWQEHCPRALTPQGWRPFKQWLAKEHGFQGRWFRRARLPDQDHSPSPGFGVNLMGPFRYPSGLQVELTHTQEVLARAGIPTATRDLPVIFPNTVTDPQRHRDLEAFDITLIRTAAGDRVDDVYRRAAIHPRVGVYRIALWYWELETFPEEPIRHADLANEFWGPTRFIADAIAAWISDRPVQAMLPGLELPPVTVRPKTHFGLDPAKFLFLFLFDFASVMERKNPLGLIEAFRRSFRPDEPVQLAIKVTRRERYPEDFARLSRAAEAAGVVILDQMLPYPETISLLATCDCYVSLHRSEGLGLTMAESMLLGKPVIATAYSGNLDFMTPDAALLVNYQKIPLTENFGPYPRGAFWADPSIDQAANLMRWVVDHPDQARQWGHRAKQHAEAVLSLEAASRRLRRRLDEIAEQRKEARA